MSDVHAKASPSSAEGWMGCLQYESDSKGSFYAREGTAAHILQARALTYNKDADFFLGEVIEVEGTKFTVDEDMAGFVQMSLDKIRTDIKDYELLTEQKLSISHLTGEPDAEGTSDVVLVPMKSDLLRIRDLKYGYRRVDAVKNKQMMIYALGTLERFGIVGDFNRVEMNIDQPRINNFSTWECSTDDLMDFAEEVKIKAKAYLDPNKPVIYTPSEEACEWCARKSTCPALKQMVVSDTGVDFEDLTQQDLPVYGDPEFLSRAMQKTDMIERWIKAVRGKVEAELLAGRPIPEYKLVAGKKGNRDWIEENEAEKEMKAMRLTQEEMYSFNILSPAKMEKKLKDNPKKWERLKKLITQKEGKISVAHSSDARPALELKPENDFSNLLEG